jgi:hypothetical protein
MNHTERTDTYMSSTASLRATLAQPCRNNSGTAPLHSTRMAGREKQYIVSITAAVLGKLSGIVLSGVKRYTPCQLPPA